VRRPPSVVDRPSRERLFAMMRATSCTKEVSLKSFTVALERYCCHENARQLVLAAANRGNKLRDRLHALQKVLRLDTIDSQTFHLTLPTLLRDPSPAIRQAAEAIVNTERFNLFPASELIYPPGWDTDWPDPPAPKRPRRRP
jgi:hypothetical protein